MQYHPCVVYSCIRRMLTCVRIVEHRLCSMQTKNLFFLLVCCQLCLLRVHSATQFCRSDVILFISLFVIFLFEVLLAFFILSFSLTLYSKKKMNLIVWTNNEYRYLKQTETARKKCFLNLHILFVSNKVRLGFWCMRSRKCGLLSSNQRAHSVKNTFTVFLLNSLFSESYQFNIYSELYATSFCTRKTTQTTKSKFCKLHSTSRD